MYQSHIFIPTRSTPATDEPSKNGKLLQQAGFVDKLHAGVYSWLPLGLRVLNRVSAIVREELNQHGAVEILMPALQPKSLWDETGRWEKLKEIMYQWEDGSRHHVGLASTHEEVIVDLMRRADLTYRDIPQSMYQFQWKFRNEPRAKSGVLRGREFLMKDQYSFHASAEDLATYYTGMQAVYLNIYKRLGLDAHVVEASGGTFTKRHSHEFQVFNPAGEDRLLRCEKGDYIQNTELGTPTVCPTCGGTMVEEKSIEVGNIFNFGDYYGTTMRCTFTDQLGKRQPLFVASYGIGITRLVGTIAEVLADEKGLVWPSNVAPFYGHALLVGKVDDALRKRAEAFEASMPENILLDDRDVSPGYKLKDADLIGIPFRIIFSARQGEHVEVTERATGTTEVLTVDQARAKLSAL